MGSWGTAIHLGVGSVHRKFGEFAPILAAQHDAEAMAGISKRAFGARQHPAAPSVTLIDDDATIEATREHFRTASEHLRSGDLFVLTFAGHGGLFEEMAAPVQGWPPGTRSRVRDEDDGWDEAWFLWDDVLIDDELNELLARFATGVRIFVLADTCHAGTSLRDRGKGARRKPLPGLPKRREEARRKIVRNNIPASVLFIPACTADGKVFDVRDAAGNAPAHGAFTAAVLRAQTDAAARKDHRAFHRAVKRLCLPGQVPRLERLGNQAGCVAFELSPPFQVETEAHERT